MVFGQPGRNGHATLDSVKDPDHAVRQSTGEGIPAMVKRVTWKLGPYTTVSVLEVIKWFFPNLVNSAFRFLVKKFNGRETNIVLPCTNLYE